MKQQILARTAILALALLSLAGCDSVRSALGMDRHVPDETQVVAHPALTLPPDYNLRPPGTATPVSAQHEAGSSMGQTPGTAGEQALENNAAAGAAPKEEKGFFGRLFDFLDPFSDDSGPAVAQPQTQSSDNSQPQPGSEQTPTQAVNGTPAPSSK